MILDEWIFLYGPPGSGKSTLGKELANRLYLPFVDLDEMIVQQSGMSIKEIFSNYGEKTFREIESNVLQKEITKNNPGVLALGGGALLSDQNRKLVENAGKVICLHASINTLINRLEGDDNRRPLLGHSSLADALQTLLSKRREHYASFERILWIDGYELDDAIWESQKLLGRFVIAGMGKPYVVVLERGLLNDLGNVFRHLRLSGPVALISDENVSKFYSQRVISSLEGHGFQVTNVIIKAGEQHKNIDSVNKVWQELADSGMERTGVLLALGGGVVNDLGGFVAATFMRGIKWVSVPTSLLAMVDASLGGKTGVDLQAGKNLVGAFYPPECVLVDPATLSTLPDVEIFNGMAEVIKHGVIADESLLTVPYTKALGIEQWMEFIPKAMAVKIRVIQEDPYEKGKRATLNLGHTLGHALEATSDFKIRHGHAVSIGMVFAAKIAQKLRIANVGLHRELAKILKDWHLPVEIPKGLDKETIIENLLFDKKVKKGTPRWILPKNFGEVLWDVQVPTEVVREQLFLE